MANVYNLLKLDVNNFIENIVVKAVQNDSDTRYLDCIMLNASIPIDLTNHTARIYMKKNDGTEIYNDGVITDAESGRVQFLMTTQMLADIGKQETQVILYKNDVEVVSTNSFYIYVMCSLITDGSVESSNEYGSLVILYQNISEAYALMTYMVENIGAPAEIAAEYSIDTMWEAWEWMVDYTGNDLTELIQEAIANSSVQGVLDLIGTPEDTADDGTVMGQINAVADVVKATQYYVPSDNAQVSVGLTTSAREIDVSGRVGRLEYKFFPEHDGFVRVTIRAKSTSAVYKTIYMHCINYSAGDKGTLYGYGPDYVYSPIDTIFGDVASTSNAGLVRSVGTSNSAGGNTADDSSTFDLRVEKGVPFFLFIDSFGYTTGSSGTVQYAYSISYDVSDTMYGGE